MTPKSTTRRRFRLCLSLVAAGISPTLQAQELLFSLAPSPDHFELGSAFATCGDLNADGVTDVAIADRSCRVSSFMSSGIVHLVSGADGSAIRDYTGVPAASQAFGAALVSLNADGDGIPDLAVGSPGQVVAGSYGAGAVRIYSGANGSLLTTALGSAGSQLGASLANAGDQNGDGIDDLYAGAPSANSSRGAVFVLSGADGSVLRQITTTASTSSFGVSLVTLGDVDGDGRADVAVGAPGFRVSGNPVGRVVLVRSSDNTVATQIVGSGVYNRLGESLAASDDVDGDGFPDLLVGSYSGGTARVVSGTDLSTLRDLSVPTLPAFRQLTVGGGLDFDGDDVMDFLIGSPALQILGTQQVGGIRVVSGLDSSTLFEYTATKPYTGLGLSLRVLPGLGMAAGETSLQDPVTLGYGMAHVWEVNPIKDTDGDGILDDVDLNPNSIMTPNVEVLGEDSLVPNRVDEQGVTLADRFAELGVVTDYPRPALYYVKVLQFAKELENGQILSKDESRQITAAAVKGLVKISQQRR